jgi:uncharacterized protein YecE (DUF72 family)
VGYSTGRFLIIMAHWYLGTIGFSYKDWDGVFYPVGTPSRSYLAHYGKIFNAVELDSTFYGTPPSKRVQHWSASVPQNFRFCVKTPRQITHELRLIEAKEAMGQFLDVVRLFGEKLGAILIQLPPSFTAGQIDTVDAFLTALPPSLPYAIEFRHESWYTSETAALLKFHDVCWSSTEYLNLPKQISLTSDFLYIRWLGRHGQFERKDHEQLDVSPQLQWWRDQIRPHLSQVKALYGFFNNDYAGHSPATCNQFKAIAGLPHKYPQLPQQGRLF